MNKFQSSFLLFTIFAFAGIVFGYGVGYFFVDIKNQGTFVSWKSLDVNNKMFREIIAAEHSIIWARASDENIYWRKLNCDGFPQCVQWVQTSEAPSEYDDFFGEYPMRKNDSCHFENNQYVHPNDQPLDVDECVFTANGEPELGIVTYYVLLGDGTIWYWTFDNTNDTIATIYFALLGFVFSIIAFRIFYIRLHKNTFRNG